jgi:hypothetical protein
MPERTLKSGIIVKTRAVPTHAIVQVGGNIKQPVAPKIPIKSIAGHTELVTAPDDSPEWMDFVQTSNEYNARIEKAKNDFIYDFAVEAWKNGAGDWQTQPPDDWEFPAIFESHGLKASQSRRADYIRYHLLIANDDVGVVLGDALGEAAPITDSEVSAALGGFQPGAKRKPDTKGRRQRHKG